MDRPQCDDHKHLLITVKIEANPWYGDITAMLDSGATSNFIDQTLLEELDLGIGVPITRAFRTLSGHALRTYNQHELALQATNTTNRTIGTAGTFIAADLKRVHMVLGLPWLVQWDVAIHPHDRK